MKATHTSSAWILLLLPFLVLLTSLGCRSADRYTYHSIAAAYRPPQAVSEPCSLSENGLEPLMPIPKRLDLNSAIRIALANNPDISISLARMRQSESMIAEAAAAFWPTIGVYGEYLQGNAPSAFLFKKIDQRLLPPDADFNYPGWFENYEAGIQARINLFSGGRDYLRKRMAETGLEIEQLDRLSIENALIASVIDGYFNLLAAVDFVEVADESVETVEAQLRTTQARYRAGGALKSDVLSLDVRLAQAREERIRAENSLSLAKAALANLLGHDPDTRLDLVRGEKVALSVPEIYTAALPEALANRPELQVVRRRLVQSRMALDAARAEYLPRIDAQGRYYFDDPGLDFERDRENWTLGVMVNWDLFSGFASRARVRQAGWALQELLATDRKTTQAIQLDLKKAYLDLAQARARHEVTLAAEAQADEALRIVKMQYEGGSADITRYLDAELARNRARMLSRAAYYDGEKALAAVGRALGRWGYPNDNRE
ncbi:Outer membrane efflux protein [uncultured Desulfatiglans sp.]|uniref:Outer membrane efflux protein n=1 Tax=Uncultured Desulfatiglans sp. TaxID=1748965 RepID=A0A653A0A0_UNCDX|nr:Outer membrane efflux protein [uncultured Desulfatiglans sp.]